MRNNFLFGIALFTLLLLASSIAAVFYISFYPFNLLQIKKASQLKPSYKIGEQLNKTLTICKETDSPMRITFELSNDDVVMLAMKESYAGRGCRDYIVSQNIPETVHTDEHTLHVTVCYKVLFRDICNTFISDKFMITK